MKRRMKLLAALGATALVVAACGEAEVVDETTTTPPPETTAPEEVEETTTTQPAEEAAGVGTVETELGTILVNPEGLTLYIFTVDTEGVSQCYDACAATWPAVPADTPISGDVDAGMFGSAPRDDGPDQLTVNGMPLYYFAGDEAPGDVEGQGFNDVWFVVDSDGNPVENPQATSGNGYGYTP